MSSEEQMLESLDRRLGALEKVFDELAERLERLESRTEEEESSGQPRKLTCFELQTQEEE